MQPGQQGTTAPRPIPGSCKPGGPVCDLGACRLGCGLLEGARPPHRPYPRRVKTNGGTTRPRCRTKACSAPAASGPPAPAAEAKGHRPRALEPLAPISGPPAHGGAPQRPRRSHRAVGAAMPGQVSARLRWAPLRSDPLAGAPPPSSAGSSVSTETSLPLPHAPRVDWPPVASICQNGPIGGLGARYPSTHRATSGSPLVSLPRWSDATLEAS